MNTIRLLFPLVAKALAAVMYLCFVGLILALFLSTGPIRLLLPLFFVRSGMLPLLSLPSFSPPGQLCFREQALQITSPLLPFLHIVEFVDLHNSHVGLFPSGIFTLKLVQLCPNQRWNIFYLRGSVFCLHFLFLGLLGAFLYNLHWIIKACKRERLCKARTNIYPKRCKNYNYFPKC